MQIMFNDETRRSLERCAPQGLSGLAKLIAAPLALCFISACTTTPSTVSVPSENYTFVQSENINSRVSSLILHHTSANFADSLDILTNPERARVSSHYLVPDPSDESYTERELKIYQLVAEKDRAWHAGRSYWNGKSALNDHSIGIEVVNQTYCVNREAQPEAQPEAPLNAAAKANENKRLCFYPDYPETQIALLAELIDDILKRHPRIQVTDIVGHSDIAPQRKIDPGPRFPWHRLYKLGYGAWFDDEDVTKYWQEFSVRPVPLINVQKALGVYGYKIEPTGVLDEQTRNVIMAFQLHFRPNELTGEPSAETTAILFALIEKYRGKHLETLLPAQNRLSLAPQGEMALTPNKVGAAP